MSARALIAINIFLGILLLLTANFATVTGGNTGILNTTTSNQTQFIQTGGAAFTGFGGDICTLAGSENPFIAALQSFVNVIPGINCVMGFTAFIFSYQSIQTGIVWLGIIIFALIMADIYIVIKLIRGGG